MKIIIFYFVSKDFFETEKQFRTEAGGVYIFVEFLWNDIDESEKKYF